MAANRPVAGAAASPPRARGVIRLLSTPWWRASTLAGQGGRDAQAVRAIEARRVLAVLDQRRRRPGLFPDEIWLAVLFIARAMAHRPPPLPGPSAARSLA